ncbi:hypothetical protein BJ741DRAFT_592130 [Chytriomyces cf. hyalinus JEL632]|nr:hypothetical protein BJ741DRAFT_592130 [Chytriomyces cf. hyalinus JEL632]
MRFLRIPTLLLQLHLLQRVASFPLNYISNGMTCADSDGCPCVSTTHDYSIAVSCAMNEICTVDYFALFNTKSVARMSCLPTLCQPDALLVSGTACVCNGAIATDSTACGQGAYCAASGKCECRDGTLGADFTCTADNGNKCAGEGTTTFKTSGCTNQVCGIGNICSKNLVTCFVNPPPVSSSLEDAIYIGSISSCFDICIIGQKGPCYCPAEERVFHQGELCIPQTTSTSTTTSKTTTTSSSTTTTLTTTTTSTTSTTTSTVTTTTSTTSSTTSTVTTTTSTTTSATTTTTTSTDTTSTTSTTTTTQTRVNAAPSVPKSSQVAPRKLSKHECEEVYAKVDVFSDSKYDALWDTVEDPAQSFRDITGQALVEEFEYHAFKKYKAKVKQCLDQNKDGVDARGLRRRMGV